MDIAQNILNRDSCSYKIKISYNLHNEILDTNSIDYRYLYEKFNINLGKNRDRNPIILAVDIRSNGEIIVTKNSFTTPVYVKIEENENWKILLVSDAFELKDSALVKIDSYEIKMEKIQKKSPKKVIVSSEKNKKRSNFTPEEQKIEKKEIEKKTYNFSSSHSQDSNNSKSNNIWDFLDDILEEDKKKKESSSKIPEIKETFDIEESPERPIENNITYRKRKPLEKNQKSFEKLEDFLSSGKKLKAESPFGKLDMTESDKEILKSRSDMRMSQIHQRNEDSQENSKLKRLKKFVHDKREENAKNSVSKMQSQIKQESSTEPCSICLSEISDFLGKLEACTHRFCFSCIKDWSDVTNECPLCKRRFEVLTKCDLDGKEIETIQVKFKRQVYEDNLNEFIENIDDGCYECGSGEHPELLLICDDCGFNCCHTFCCSPPLDTIPLEDWYCKFCSRTRRQRRRGGRRATNRNNSNSESNPTAIRGNQRTTSSRSTRNTNNSRNRNRSRQATIDEFQPSLLEALFEKADDFESQYIGAFADDDTLYHPFYDEEESNRSRRSRETSNRNRERSRRNNRINAEETQNSLDLRIETRTTSASERNRAQNNQFNVENLNSFRYPPRGTEK